MNKPPNDSFGPFEATHWPLVEQAAHQNPLFRQAALTDLLRRYRPALRAHLVFKRQLDRNSAEDVLQGFISDKIIERNILRLADQSKGQFRLLLLKSLDNYLRDEWRRVARRGETGSDIEASSEPVAQVDEADVFDIAWTRQVLTQVLARMRGDCESAGRLQVWEIFLSRVWLAAVSGRELESYDSLVTRLGLDSPAQASNLLMTAKRQFRRTLEGVIGEYVTGPAAVLQEVAELQRILAAGRDVLIGLPYDQLTETPLPVQPSPESARHMEASLPWPVGLQVESEETATWSDQDLAGLLRHQLGLPLASLALLTSAAEPPSDFASEVSTPPPLSDLFTAATPCLEALRQIKDICKTAPQTEAGLLPKEVATVLYYAAIAAAYLRAGELISSSSREVIADGLFRVLAIPWCNPELRRLFAETHLALRAESNRSPEA